VKNDIVINDELIARYLAGEAGPEEAMALQDWLEHAENRLHFEALRASWYASFPSRTPRPVSRDVGWATLQEKMLRPVPAVEKSRASFSPWFKIAASMLLVASVGIIAYIKLTPADVVLHSMTSDNDLKEFTLPDRSTVVLSKNSTVEYPEQFNDSKREINFKRGEAFFRIESNVEKPFVIHAALADIQVVGTAFNVVQNGDALEVSVDEGKVLVVTPTSREYLEPGTRARIVPGADPVQIDRAADANTWGYATRRFVFKDTPMDQVVQCMEKAYPFTIRFSKSTLGNCKLTGTFDHLSGERMLTLIAETLNFKVTKHDTVYTMEGNDCQ
jgi:transmembrane sensor